MISPFSVKNIVQHKRIQLVLGFLISVFNIQSTFFSLVPDLPEFVIVL